MYKKLLFSLLLAGLSVIHLAADEISEVLVLADFNKGNQNALGGYFNRFEREPAKATVDLTSFVFRGDNGKSLEIMAQNNGTGFCGAWMHFFDFRSETKTYFNALSYNYLSFWVKGDRGGEQFTVKVADKRLIELEDSAIAGQIEKFLPGGVNQEWQEVLVPLNQLVNVDKTKLGGLIFDFDTPGDYKIYVDDIALKKTKKSVVAPEITRTNEEKSREALSKRSIPPRTAWVWTVYEILENKNNEQATLFETCKRENIGRLWLQIPTRYEPNVDLSADVGTLQPPEFKISFRNEEKLRAFIRQAHARGIKVEGLDGYPEFAQKPYHFIPLAIVDAVIDYNQRVNPEERFDGVHFDNEPYLIIGWKDKERREQILQEFLELNIECQRRIRENSDMVYGVDVPFWWNAADPAADGAIGDVTFNGERKPAVYFCIDFLDNIGIMNYRDTTFGADGIITHAAPILEYAEKAGNEHVYVGLEVFRYEPTKVWFPIGLPRGEFHDALLADAKKLSYLSRVNGFRTQLLDDGINVHVGIELPTDPDEAMQQKINETLVELARRLGVGQSKILSQRDVKKMPVSIQREISANPEWESYEPAEIVDPKTSQKYPGFKAVSIMLGKTTFADESYDEFKKQLTNAENELILYPAYTGTALHYYKVLNDKFNEHKSAKKMPCCESD